MITFVLLVSCGVDNGTKLVPMKNIKFTGSNGGYYRLVQNKLTLNASEARTFVVVTIELLKDIGKNNKIQTGKWSLVFLDKLGSPLKGVEPFKLSTSDQIMFDWLNGKSGKTIDLTFENTIANKKTRQMILSSTTSMQITVDGMEVSPALETLKPEKSLQSSGSGNIVTDADPKESGYVIAMRKQLQIFCNKATEWYRTPVTQGGAGMSLQNISKQKLSAYLKFDPKYNSIQMDVNFNGETNEGIFGLISVSNDNIVIGVNVPDDGFTEGALLTATIDLKTLSVKVVRNKAYDGWI